MRIGFGTKMGLAFFCKRYIDLIFDFSNLRVMLNLKILFRFRSPTKLVILVRLNKKNAFISFTRWKYRIFTGQAVVEIHCSAMLLSTTPFAGHRLVQL